MRTRLGVMVRKSPGLVRAKVWVSATSVKGRLRVIVKVRVRARMKFRVRMNVRIRFR